MFGYFVFMSPKKVEVTVNPPVENNQLPNTTNTPPAQPSREIEGDKGNLVSFSVTPNQEVSGKMHVTGTVKGGYFFEANIGLNILNAAKQMLKAGHGTATTDWMTAGPVSFQGDLDFTSLPKGNAYIEIHNDNTSGLPQNDKFIRIPVVIK